MVRGLILTCLWAAPSAPPRTHARGISAQHHAWGRFHPGAWKLVRVVTETFDDHGALASTNLTETKTTLQVESDGVSLEIEVGMEVAGKQFDAQPQCIKQGFHGELLSPDLKVKPSQASELTVDDRKVPCRSQQMVGRRRQQDPYHRLLLRHGPALHPQTAEHHHRPRRQGNLGSNQPRCRGRRSALEILGEIKRVACVKTVQKHAKGSVITLAMTFTEVPGGVVCHTSSEKDPAAGSGPQRVALVCYGLQPEQERVGLFGGASGRRAGKGRIRPPGERRAKSPQVNNLFNFQGDSPIFVERKLGQSLQLP